MGVTDGDLTGAIDDPGGGGTPGVVPPAAWRMAVSLVLSLAGLGVAVYLTIDHFAKISPVCGDSGLINCTKVTTSAQSYFLGIPVAVLGLAFYVVMTAINLPPAWRSADRRVHIARLVLISGGMLFALYLVSAELIIIGNICLWCTSVHAITFLLFVLIVSTVPAMLGWGQGGGDWEEEDWEPGAWEDGDWEVGDHADDAGSPDRPGSPHSTTLRAGPDRAGTTA